MNLRRLEEHIRQAELPVPESQNLEALHATGQAISIYWKAQLVICSVLLHEPHYEKWDALRRQAEQFDTTVENIWAARREMFSTENINLEGLPVEVRNYYVESLFRGDITAKGTSHLDEMTIRTLQYVKEHTTNAEEARLAELGLEWVKESVRRKLWR